MVIDVHVHTERLQTFRVNGPLDELLRDMDRAGVDMAVCIDSVALFYDSIEGNREFAKKLKPYQDRLRGYFSLSSARFGREALDLFQQGVEEWGLVGLKIYSWPYPGTDRVWLTIDNDDMYRFFEKAIELDVPVLAHTNPEETDSIASRYPELKLIMAHMGNTAIAEGNWHGAVHVAKRHPNVYLEICTSSNDLGILEHTVSELGAGRVLFGSDWPLFRQEYHLARVRSAAIPPEAQEQVLGGNAARLFKLPYSPASQDNNNGEAGQSS